MALPYEARYGFQITRPQRPACDPALGRPLEVARPGVIEEVPAGHSQGLEGRTVPMRLPRWKAGTRSTGGVALGAEQLDQAEAFYVADGETGIAAASDVTNRAAHLGYDLPGLAWFARRVRLPRHQNNLDRRPGGILPALSRASAALMFSSEAHWPE